MDKQIQIQELTIVIAVKNHNPSILNVDFLKYSGMIDETWELAATPVCTSNGSQIVFKNQVNLTALPNRIEFSEVIANKLAAAVAIPEIAKKYIAMLPNLDYQAVGINPRGHVTFETESAVQQYVNQKLLASGSWQELNGNQASVALRIAYPLDKGGFFLGIEEGKIREKDDQTIPVVVFSGNFNYNLQAEEKSGRTQELCQHLNDWHKELETYSNTINQKFLTLA